MFNFFSSDDKPTDDATQTAEQQGAAVNAPQDDTKQSASVEAATPEPTDIDSLAAKYAPKDQATDAGALLATVQALQAELAQLKGQAQQQPQQTPQAPDVFTPEQFEQALENPQMLRSGIENMISTVLQGHMTELRDIVKETVTGTTQRQLQEYQATQQAHSSFYEGRPHLAPYKDMVRMVANELQPRYGTGNQKQFMDLVGAVATERLKSFGVAFPNQPTNQQKAPVLPTVQTTNPSAPTANNGMTPGEAFIASIF